MVYEWLLNRIRSISAAVGAYSSVCALCTTMIAVAVVLVVSLIPLYLSCDADEALGEVYCINNYSITVGFEIPQYTTTFQDSKATPTPYVFTSVTTGLTVNLGFFCPGVNIVIDRTENIGVSETCSYQTISIISPALPNAKVFDNYALSEACYRTLQTCYSDTLLTSCLLSNCVVVSLSTLSAGAAYPLTYYTLRCSAKIYYKTRCLDSPASYGLLYSSSQQNSVCRQQRLNRINTCLNSTVQIMNVPCLISVSSGLVTSATGTCTQVVSSTSLLTWGNTIVFATSTQGFINPVQTLLSTFTSTAFSASDDTTGHVYQISTINSQNYASTQPGALYCGVIARAQIASTINIAINSQTSG